MPNRLTIFLCAGAASLVALTAATAQTNSPAPAPSSSPAVAPIADVKTKPSTPPLPTGPSTKNDTLLLVQAATSNAATSPAPGATTTTTTATTSPGPVEPDSVTDNGGVGVREFQGDDVGAVLRLLARQAKINMVVSEGVQGTVTMRLEDVTALQAIEIIARSKGLSHVLMDNVHYVKTAAESDKEPTESGNYQFSYAQVATPQALSLSAAPLEIGKGAAPSGSGATGTTMSSTSVLPNPELLKLIKSQLQSGIDPQFDVRTNTVFYREVRSNMEKFQKFLVQIDQPTKQVMIEARLVEVTANPKQTYGIDWTGVAGGKTINFGGSTLGTNKLVDAQNQTPNPVPGGPPILSPKLDANGIPVQGTNIGSLPAAVDPPINFLRDASNGLKAIGGQFAILSIPQMSVTLSALNADSDAEFLANPRIVTADNLPAKIEILRAQPVPTLAFNNQTGQSVFNGFEDKTFGNTLLVKPSVNKDKFITLSVKPSISNKVGDQPFQFLGSSVSSPIIDSRSLESNVLIKSGDTLAIGGLMQDAVTKSRTKVPVMGDIPVLGYLFQSRSNERVKRNLLVFVTPTIIDQHYGTGLEDQVSGLHHTGEEYADPNGWRNNAKGAVRLVPTSNRHVAADYPKPGTPPAPARTDSDSTTTTTKSVDFKTSANERGF